jgi:hypothetical protein
MLLYVIVGGLFSLVAAPKLTWLLNPLLFGFAV